MSEFIKELQVAVNIGGVAKIGNDTLEPYILGNWVEEYKSVKEILKSEVELSLSPEAPVLQDLRKVSAWAVELYSSSFANTQTMEKLYVLLKPVLEKALKDESTSHYEFYLAVMTAFYKVVRATTEEEGNSIKKSLRDEVENMLISWVHKSNEIIDAHYPESETFYDTECQYLENNWELIEVFNPRYQED